MLLKYIQRELKREKWRNLYDTYGPYYGVEIPERGYSWNDLLVHAGKHVVPVHGPKRPCIDHANNGSYMAPMRYVYYKRYGGTVEHVVYIIRGV